MVSKGYLSLYGITATTIAVQCLRNIGLEVDYFINNRFVEGYGISPLGVDNMLKKVPDAELILTVDNGIVAYEGIEYAVSKGLDVLVTDHHLAEERLPEQAVAVVNPHRLDDDYPFADICGATVIYKVMLALYWTMGLELDFVYSMIDLVGMATVGDVMPLYDENRYYVNEGLRLIEQGSRKQMVILRNKTNVSVLTEEAFGFQFCPAMNAVGRLEGTPTKAMEFLLTEDESEMERLADELLQINVQRKELTAEQEKVGEELMKGKEDDKIIIVSHPDFHEGIIGLVAGRLKERYHRPVIVFSEKNGIMKGSSRSIEEFHMKNSLDKVKHLTLGHGGHKLAAGLSIKSEDYEAFSKEMTELAETTLTEEDLVAKVMIDAVLNPEEVTRELIEEMDQLRPFGQGFAKPVFGLNKLKVDEAVFIGSDKTHLKLIDKQNDVTLLMFRYSEDYKRLGHPKVVKALGSPSLNIFRNKVSVQFNVLDDCLAY